MPRCLIAAVERDRETPTTPNARRHTTFLAGSPLGRAQVTTIAGAPPFPKAEMPEEVAKESPWETLASLRVLRAWELDAACPGAADNEFGRRARFHGPVGIAVSECVTPVVP